MRNVRRCREGLFSWQGAFCHPKIGKSPHFYKSRAQRVRGLRNLRREKRHLPRSRRGACRAGAGRGGGTDCASRGEKQAAVRGVRNRLRFGRLRHAGSFAVRGRAGVLPCGRAGRSIACCRACGPVGGCGARPVGGGLRAPRPLLLGFEHLLAYAALGAGPVVGQLLERGAGCDAVVGIADRRVVNPVADGAFVLFHCLFF